MSVTSLSHYIHVLFSIAALCVVFQICCAVLFNVRTSISNMLILNYLSDFEIMIPLILRLTVKRKTSLILGHKK